MRMLEDKAVTREERIMVIALNSRSIVLLLGGLLTSLGVLVIIGGVLLMFGAILKTPSPVVLPISQFAYFSVFLLVFGALTARLKTVQYALRRAASRGSSVFEVVATSLNFIFPMAIFAFIFLLQVSMQSAINTDPWEISMLYLITSLFMTMIIKQLWDLFFGNLLIFSTSVDWRLIIDKERFSHMLRQRFDESKRYPGPFAMMMIGIQNYDVLAKRINRNRMIMLQEHIIDFVNRSVRTVDLVARLEQGQYIGVLMHTSSVEARIPAERIIEQSKEFSVQIGKEEAVPVFRFGIAAFETSMQHERELYEKALGAVKSASEETPLVSC